MLSGGIGIVGSKKDARGNLHLLFHGKVVTDRGLPDHFVRSGTIPPDVFF
jgi:hypothetical protein